MSLSPSSSPQRELNSRDARQQFEQTLSEHTDARRQDLSRPQLEEETAQQMQREFEEQNQAFRIQNQQMRLEIEAEARRSRTEFAEMRQRMNIRAQFGINRSRAQDPHIMSMQIDQPVRSGPAIYITEPDIQMQCDLDHRRRIPTEQMEDFARRQQAEIHLCLIGRSDTDIPELQSGDALRSFLAEQRLHAQAEGSCICISVNKPPALILESHNVYHGNSLTCSATIHWCICDGDPTVCRSAIHNCSCKEDAYSCRSLTIHSCICHLGNAATCRSQNHTCICQRHNPQNASFCLADGIHRCICQRTEPRNTSECLATDRHSCICTKRIPENSSVCQAAGNHSCICSKSRPDIGAHCLSDNHHCICSSSRPDNIATCRRSTHTARNEYEQLLDQQLEYIRNA